MEDKIIVMFQPFDKLQNIMVYQNGERVEEIKVEAERVPASVRGLASKYNINTVSLCGSKAYLAKFQQEITANANFNQALNVDII